MTALARSLLLVAMLGGPGCLAPGRAADLRDSGRIGIGIGLGLSADAKIGDLTHPALGIASASAMVGFEARDIDGPFYEANVSDPFATYWWRREGGPWGFSLNSSGWRGVWESVDWVDAIDEIDEPVDMEPLPETGTVWEEETLDGSIVVRRWLPIPGGAEQYPGLWSFNTASDLQLGATLLIVNVRLGFNPLEFVDFLLGFGGLDIAGDDPEPGAPAKPQ
jgi:hypothetical protein